MRRDRENKNKERIREVVERRRRDGNVHAAASEPGRGRNRVIARSSRAGSRRTGQRH